MCNKITSSLIFLLVFNLLGCVEVERSASGVLENANSVAKSARGTLWQEPENEPTATPTAEADSDESKNRY